MSTQSRTQTLQVPADLVPDIEARHRYPEVTDEIAAVLRELVDEILVPGRTRRNKQVMHIPGDDGSKLCQGRAFTATTKDVECYPPGYRSWCRECAARYRLRHGGVVDG